MPNNKRNKIIKRFIISLISLAMIAGFIVLFVSASKDRNKATCKGVAVSLDKKEGKVFVDRFEIKQLITGNKILDPVGKKLDQLNIQMLERSVETYPWVKDAELYIDNDNMLQINIVQRHPLIRVFTISGNSFYIDRDGKRVPANGNFVVRVPVVTGFPSDAVKLHSDDSLLFTQIVDMGRYIAKDSFWMAQVDQININANKKFEIIPKVGNALIEFGKGKDIEEKFSKLLAFYKKGLNNVGWGTYDTLDVRFSGQVVAKREDKDGSPVVQALMTPNAPESLLDVREKIAESKLRSKQQKNKKQPFYTLLK